MLDHDVAEVLICESSDDIEHRRSWDIEESKEEHTKDVLELRIPVRSEKLFENIDKSLREDLLRFCRMDMEWIESERELLIGRIEDDDVFFPIFWYVHHHLFDEISMWIDDSESLPIGDIIDHHRYEEFGLSYTGFSHDIHMTEAVFIVDTEWYTHTSVVRLSEDAEGRVMWRYDDLSLIYTVGKYGHTDRKCEFASIDLEESGLLGRIVWKVEEVGYLFCREDE